MSILSLDIGSKGAIPIVPHVFIGDAIDIPYTDPRVKNPNPIEYKVKGAVFKSLLDTGASRTCISKKVVDALKLHSVSAATMNSASHSEHLVSCYDVVVQIMDRQITKEKISHEGKLIPRSIANHPVSRTEIIRAMEFASNEYFDVLIGMDIISTGLVVLSGPDGRLTISF